MPVKKIIEPSSLGYHANLDRGKTNLVYIGGQVSGLTPEQYHKKFEECRKFVEKNIPKKYQVVIPMDLCEDDWDWSRCMEACVPVIRRCIALFLMPDWYLSKGATCERYIAEAAGVRIIDICETGNSDPENRWRFHQTIDGITNPYKMLYYNIGDIVVTENDEILDYHGYYMAQNVIFSLCVDKNNKAYGYTDKRIVMDDIKRLATEQEKERYRKIAKLYVGC